MDISDEVNALKELLPSVSTTVILLPDNASRDAIAAGLSLYLSLSQLGKTVTIACPRPPIVGWSHLVGVNKLVQSIGNKNFVISLDYQEGSIEKVSYNIEGNKFNLVIEPRAGAPPFNEKKVNYHYSGFTADLIIGLSVPTLEHLGKYYSDNKQLFQDKTVVAIDYRPTTHYGKVNIVRAASSISEVVTLLLKATEVPITMDIASNLYDGIVGGSRNFTATAVTADTFEAVAYLLRLGARKSPMKQEEMPDKELVTSKPEGPQAPPDWLKPKIYSSRGPTLL